MSGGWSTVSSEVKRVCPRVCTCVCQCACVSEYTGELAEESKEACVFKREEDERRKHISRTNLSSVFNMVSEHTCSNRDMIGAAYVHSPAH